MDISAKDFGDALVQRQLWRDGQWHSALRNLRRSLNNMLLTESYTKSDVVSVATRQIDQLLNLPLDLDPGNVG